MYEEERVQTFVGLSSLRLEDLKRWRKRRFREREKERRLLVREIERREKRRRRGKEREVAVVVVVGTEREVGKVREVVVDPERRFEEREKVGVVEGSLKRGRG